MSSDVPAAGGDRHRAKWEAFWLSLLMPGAGQLWLGRWTGLAYLGAVGVLASRPEMAPGWVWGAAGVALTLLSAERAKRRLEVERGERSGRRSESRVIDRDAPGRGIDLTIEVALDRPLAEVWVRMADLAEFVTIDPFHSRIIVMDEPLRPGATLAIEHRAFGWRFFRFGRLLWWREGVGYAFSDLSPRGRSGFFPHVFTFAADEQSDGRSRLVVRVRGLWTSRRWPRWVGRGWFRYVAHEHARLLRKTLG